MSDILCSVPYPCDDKDCEQEWHLGTYWMDDDGGYTYDALSDGDHEKVESGPDTGEYDAAWRDYYEHVIRSESDPLGELSVPTHRDETERWWFMVREAIDSRRNGITLVGARRGNSGRFSLDNLPKHVLDWLSAKRRGLRILLPEFKTELEFRKAAAVSPECDRITTKWGTRISVKLKHRVPRGPVTVKRELLQAARAALRHLARTGVFGEKSRRAC